MSIGVMGEFWRTVALLGLVMPGASSTVRVTVSLAGAPIPLVAVIATGCTPPAPTAGVPPRVAVPLWLSVRLTPAGSADRVVKAGAGYAWVVVAVKENAVPTWA